MMDKVPKRKIVSVNVWLTCSALLEFLTLEGGTDMLYRNICKELPLNAAECLRKMEILHNDLLM